MATGYVDPTFGAAPVTADKPSWSLDPTKGWVENPGTPSPGAGQSPGAIIAGAQNNLGYQFSDYNGTQTRTDPGAYTDAQTGADTFNKASGQNLSAFEYDKMTNPTSYGARWAADGTQLQYDASGKVVSGTPGPAGQQGTTSSGQGTTVNPVNPAINNTTAGQQANQTLASSSVNTGLISGARGGQGGKGGAAVPGTGASGYTPWNVAANQTVEGRIASIMNPNNPIIAMARAGSLDAMNARGLSDSSLAISAGDRAAYEAAMPIAQQDAATFAKAGGYNADIQNQMSMQGRQIASQEKVAQLNADTQKYTAGLSAQTQQSIAALNSDTQKWTAQLDAGTRTQVQQMQSDNQRLLQTNSNAATGFNQSMVAIANIEQNDKMDAAAKTAAIAQIMQNLQMQLKTIGTVANIDVAGSLDFRNMPGFDAQGRWVGFPGGAAGTSTSGTATQPLMTSDGAQP